MTFSVIGRCGRTGMFGVAITTSSIAVASRCPWARAGAGAVATQSAQPIEYQQEILVFAHLRQAKVARPAYAVDFPALALLRLLLLSQPPEIEV